jgi:hypothetical protein
MTEDQFYGIWNRACTENGGTEPLEGDVALTRMLLGHGYIMNGGLDHFQDLSEQEQRESICGFRFFHFDCIADLILRTPRLSKDDLDHAHNAVVEFDAGMLNKVRSYIEAHPHLFRSP